MSTLKVIDKGAAVRRKNLAKLRSKKVSVGLIDKVGGVGTGSITNASKAFFFEFGTANQPPRPALRTMSIANRKHVSKHFRQSILKIGIGKETIHTSLRKLGQHGVDEFQFYLEVWDDPPNAPSTALNKGFDDPGIETYEMIEAVSFEVTT